MDLPTDYIEQLITLVRLVAAMTLSGLIGLDQEAAQKSAGLRTNI